jgi:hypothetical protein
VEVDVRFRYILYKGRLGEQLGRSWVLFQQTGFRRYFELLFLVKAESKCDEVWFSFFEGMHRHATIVAGLLCSKFNYITNELELRNIDVE